MPRLLAAGLLGFCLLIAGCGGGDDSSSEAEQMAEGHEGDTPTATGAAREPRIPVDGENVSYATLDGEEVTGYLAAPSSPDSVLLSRGVESPTFLPGVLVIHEWWGLNDNIRTATRRLAGEGYRVLAVDLYDDSTAQTPSRAQSLMQKAKSNTERLRANLRAAHDYLRAESGGNRVAVMGWCFGGGMTFRAVADRPTAFDAAVAYYGTPAPMTEAVLSELTTPVMTHFGRRDEVVSTKQVDALRARLKGMDKEVQIYEYDAGHAFANPSGENYDPEAASTAWSRTTRFLRTHLYSEMSEK